MSSRRQAKQDVSKSTLKEKEAVLNKAFTAAWAVFEKLGWCEQDGVLVGPHIPGYPVQLPPMKRDQFTKLYRQKKVRALVNKCCSCLKDGDDFCDLESPPCLAAAKAKLLPVYKEIATENAQANVVDQNKVGAAGSVHHPAPSTPSIHVPFHDLTNTGSSAGESPYRFSSSSAKPNRASFGGYTMRTRKSYTPGSGLQAAAGAGPSAAARGDTTGATHGSARSLASDASSDVMTVSPKALDNECSLETDTIAHMTLGAPSDLERLLEETHASAAQKDHLIDLHVRLDDPVQTQDTRAVLEEAASVTLPTIKQHPSGGNAYYAHHADDDHDEVYDDDGVEGKKHDAKPAGRMSAAESSPERSGMSPNAESLKLFERVRVAWAQHKSAVGDNKTYCTSLKAVVNRCDRQMEERGEPVERYTAEIEERSLRLEEATDQFFAAHDDFKAKVASSTPYWVSSDEGRATISKALDDIQDLEAAKDRAESDLESSKLYLEVSRLVKEVVCEYLRGVRAQAHDALASAEPDIRAARQKGEEAVRRLDRKLRRAFDAAREEYNRILASYDRDIQDCKDRIWRERRRQTQDRDYLKELEKTLTTLRNGKEDYRKELNEMTEEMEVWEHEYHTEAESLTWDDQDGVPSAPGADAEAEVDAGSGGAQEDQAARDSDSESDEDEMFPKAASGSCGIM